MREQPLHVADERLLLYAGGEISAASSRQIRDHLDGCAACRMRLKYLESRLAQFGETQRETWAELPPAAGPRALLKARLAELAERERSKGWLRSARGVVFGHRQTAVLAGAAMAACVALAIGLHPGQRSQPTPAALAHWDEPNLQLTPGATVPVTADQVCRADAERAAPVVPVSLERKVFEEYGVTPPRPDAYEVDYLITPELGGATDIRNLWPEPYQDTVWNAHVKDQLEHRLHRMVCRGDVDLATAQHDISSDWIAAYRKYFHADRPIADSSSFDFSSRTRSLPRT
ncbi:MAG: zf-HC2 domain-containing protein [Candidatus Sulfotelmatobacter sp.]